MRFFYAATDQFFELTLDYFLVQLYNLLGHGLQTPFRMVCGNFILPEVCKGRVKIFSHFSLQALA